MQAASERQQTDNDEAMKSNDWGRALDAMDRSNRARVDRETDAMDRKSQR